MLSSLRNSLKDQIQFSLTLFTGLFAGSILTLVYIKLWEKGDVTFSDIGGMFAGAGTIGLLILAFFTANSWKKQIIESAKRDSLEKFYEVGTKTVWTMMFFLRTLEDIEYAKHQGNHSAVLQDQTRDKNSEACVEYAHGVAKLDLSWELDEFSGLLPIDVINLFIKIEELHTTENFATSFIKSKQFISDFQKKFDDKYNSIKKRL